MRVGVAIVALAALLAASCGGDSGGFPGASEAGDVSSGSKTDNIDPCALLTDAEISAVLGSVPTSEFFGPNGPFTGCSWGTGDLSVSIATTDELILAPGERERCDPGDLGEDSLVCPGEVTFLLNGIQVGVSTISNTTIDQILALARTIPSKLPS